MCNLALRIISQIDLHVAKRVALIKF
jgi:F-type H+-transporting ATPase subunit a